MFNRIYVQNTGNAFEDDGVNASNYTNLTDQSVQIVDPSTGNTIDVSADLGSGNQIDAYDEIQLVFRDGEEVDYSPVIDVSQLQVSEMRYSAPVLQQEDVQFPSPSASNEGVWHLKVTDLSSGAQPFEYYHYDAEVVASDSAGDVVNKFAEAIASAEDSINDEPGSVVTPYVDSYSGSVTGIQTTGVNADVLRLEGNSANIFFDVSTRNFNAASITTNQDPSPGLGTPDQVRDYEKRDDATLSRYTQEDNLLGSQDRPTMYADDSNNYDMVNFRFQTDYDENINRTLQEQQTIVALSETVSLAANNAADAFNANGAAGSDGTADWRQWLAPVVTGSINAA